MVETITFYSYGISTKKNILTLRKTTYKILPKIKFIRKREKRVLLEKIDLANYKIDVPFQLKKVKKSRSWHGNGMQCDDINCYSEWEEEVKIYDKEILSEFIINCFSKNGIDYLGKTNQGIN